MSILPIEFNKVSLDSQFWHNRLGHPYFSMMKQISNEMKQIYGSDDSMSFRAYRLGKSHRLPFFTCIKDLDNHLR